jgi:peptidoglycan/LPS O-acetylase OafA/YrhL
MKFLIAAPSLGASSVGRENNINLIRLAAAIAVVISHSALITAGREAMPPLMWLLGSIAVWVFFSISGFLIARSFDRAPSSVDYCAARVLRIFPALAACVVVTALVLGPMVTSEPLSSYLVSSDLWRFLFGNLTLFWESRALPGVFKDHPVDHAQITFWTLKFEMICYIGVLLLGTLGAFRNRILFAAFAASFVLLWALAVYAVETADNSTGVLPKSLYSFLKVGIYFVLGKRDGETLRGHA